MEKYTDIEIIEGLRYRNNEIVDYIYSRYTPMIRSMILEKGGNLSYVDDIFQEGLYAILLKVRGADFVLQNKFKTYFYATCLNQLKLVLRQKKPQENYFRRKLAEDDEYSSADNIDRKVIEQAIRDAFEELGFVCKTILKLYWRDNSLKEISNIISIDYARTRRRKLECEEALTNKVKSCPVMHCLLKNETVPY